MAAQPMPKVYTWNDVTRYHDIASFSTQTAKELDTVATYEEAALARCQLQDEKDALSTTSQQETLRLQVAMEHKAQLEFMVSNTMKAYGDQVATIAAKLEE